MDVHRQEGAAQAAGGERRFAGRLHGGVDRQLQVVARHRPLRDELAARRRLAEGVDLDPGDARLPPQVPVVGVLDPFGTDRFAGFELPVARLLEVFFGDLADAAYDVGGEGFMRVAAHEDPLDVDPGEATLVLFQVVDEIVADVAAQGHGDPWGSRQFFVQRPPHMPQRGVCQFGQPCQLGTLARAFFGQLLGVDQQRQAGPVGDHDVAGAVEDVPARGGDAEFPGPVAVRFGEELLAVEDLQEPETEEEDREQDQGDASEDRQPQGEAVVHLGPASVGAKVHPATPRLPAPSVACASAPAAPRRGRGAGCAAPAR